MAQLDTDILRWWQLLGSALSEIGYAHMVPVGEYMITLFPPVGMIVSVNCEHRKLAAKLLGK